MPVKAKKPYPPADESKHYVDVPPVVTSKRTGINRLVHRLYIEFGFNSYHTWESILTLIILAGLIYVFFLILKFLIFSI